MAIEITWLGRTCFRIRGREGTVVMDPLPADSGFKPGKLTGDIVTQSRANDPQFGDPSVVGGSPRVLNAPGEYEIGGVLATAVALPYSDGTRNVAFIIEMELVRIAHLGLLSSEGKVSIPAELEDVDIVLLPAGDGPSLDGRQAADLITSMDPSVAIPMLYKTDQERMELEGLEKFLSETGAKPEPQPRYSTTKSGLPENLTVVVLQASGG
ncbi:MAG: MBL fold metallo-hydrolase [Dehalococcoidia bacterium]|nr:MBL fold metallo-hydrolase [Dehalococcoidia bacterium]